MNKTRIKTRIEKATDYMNKHKAKKCIIESRTKILKELVDAPNCHRIISGATASFVKAVTNRFKGCFYILEYMDILAGMNDDYTEKQIKFYNWV